MARVQLQSHFSDGALAKVLGSNSRHLTFPVLILMSSPRLNLAQCLSFTDWFGAIHIIISRTCQERSQLKANSTGSL